jgi:1,5-anhydro-D-fructose reductase (1,5-anhydro-D-mannitol-forming)
MPKLAFLGCAHIHTPGFINNVKGREAFSVSVVWDHDQARATKRAEELGARVEASLDAAIGADDMDGFIVCSETNLHEQIVSLAAKTGKPLFVEKPLAMGAADAAVMAKAIEEGGCLYSTGYFMRGSASIQTLKRHVEAGSFGQITRVRASNCHSGALGGWFDGEWRWMADVDQAGVGAYGDLGTHSLDLLLWLFGPVESATGLVAMGTARYEGCDETGEGLLKFKSGVIGTLAAAWDDIANPTSFIVSGTKGHAIILDGDLYLKIEGDATLDGKTPAPLDPSKPAGLDAWLDAMVEKSGGELVTAAEAAERSAVMEAIYQGAKTSSWVSL